ncbi:MAG: hypothetical protein K6B15_01960, partial [Parasporobacterium sp.]|nr:hypothetical protein [Parasporobacterium sp.]
MVKKKFAKIMTATLVASMIMGMTVVANAEDEATLSAQAKALEAVATEAANNAEGATTIDDLQLYVDQAAKSLSDAEALLAKAKAAYDAAVKAKDEAGTTADAQKAKADAEQALADYKKAKETVLYYAYQDMLNAAIKKDENGNAVLDKNGNPESVITRVYTGTENEDGTLSFGREDANTTYWAAAEKFMLLYLNYVYGDEATISAKDNNKSGLAEFAPNSVADTYGNYWDVTLADGSVKKFNFHVIDKAGNIEIVDKTLHAEVQAVEAVEAVEEQQEVTAFVNSANQVYDSFKNFNGISKTLDNGTTEDTTDDTIYAATGLLKDYCIDNFAAFTSGLRYDKHKNALGEYTRETATYANETKEYSIEEREFADGTYVDHSDNYGGWFKWGAAGKVKDAVNEWLAKDEFNSATVTYEIKILGLIPAGEKTVNINSMSDWDKFWSNLGTSISGCKFNVEFKSTGHHTEKVIVEKVYADVTKHTESASWKKIIGPVYWVTENDPTDTSCGNMLVKTNVYSADAYTYKILQAYVAPVEGVEGVDYVPEHWSEVVFAKSTDLTALFTEVAGKLESLAGDVTNTTTDYNNKVKELDDDDNAITAAGEEVSKIEDSITFIQGEVDRAKAVVIPEEENNNENNNTENTTPDANVPANVDVITDNVNVAADDANAAAPAMNANLLVAQAPVA